MKYTGRVRLNSEASAAEATAAITDDTSEHLMTFQQLQTGVDAPKMDRSVKAACEASNLPASEGEVNCSPAARRWLLTRERASERASKQSGRQAGYL